MSRLPVIVGFGGVNPAGRSSLHHGYRRMVIDKLGTEAQDKTFASLAALMNRDGSTSAEDRQFILDHTLIRRLETNLFDANNIPLHKRATIKSTSAEAITFSLKRNHVPDNPPENWALKENEDGTVDVTVPGDLDILFNDTRSSRVLAAGQLPTGFEPEKLYQSRNHPRGLQLTVFGASDALNSLGISWDEVRKRVPADQISVYASSAMGQLDTNGSGGLLQAGLMGKRVSSKNLPLGLAEMTADFVNAYILGNVGTTGANIGACATFLYNLRQGIQDIQSGKFRAVLVGGSEAPLTPDVIEGYRTMGALAEDEALNKIDGVESGEANHRRACRPFAENCGFTLSEGSQFIILFDDKLALELGANIYGAVADVFINADGYKKSIPGPGIGNYVTVGKAMGVIRSILGEDALRNRTYMQAHGTSTPQNRVTESHIFNELANAFGINKWPVGAIKAYIGHSLACASADQLIGSLGVWQEGIIPGIATSDQIAEDVHQSHLDFMLQHREIETTDMDAVFINSKGFGGNNATAAVMGPHVVRRMLEKKHGKDAMTRHAGLNEAVVEESAAYDESMIAGENSAIYNFGVGVVQGEELTISNSCISIPGLDNEVSLEVENPYSDFV
ncbi:MAG: beta-ketoacyl synthase [Pseudomonadales bacterium]|nr:beta-ketoacyl synthase [Pseudomonadales bacterium]MBO6565864.1 beta-ketoacyl synthase [Pseudomonadales bacterium]MBO6596463.1 beta-ketoacyl synthase [Pseudomonadales bacterium]MBO6657669.1 beta-ketoacyl synthase [Pseudomonadales bacterium]MBO6822943.1 beta-ketoacyl synthase [Pseudomonadales bacterium]